MNIIKAFFHSADMREYMEVGRAKTAVFYSEAIVTGKCELYDIYAADGDKMRILGLATTLTKGTDFVFANVIENAASKMGLTAEAVLGEGSSDGVVGEFCGEKYFLGNKRFVKEHGVTVPYGVRHTDFSGYRVIYVARKKEFLGLLLFCDELSSEAVEAIHFFRDNGIKTAITGRINNPELLKKRTSADEIYTAVLNAKRQKVLQELKKGGKIIEVKTPCDVQKYVHLCFLGGRLLQVRRMSVIAAGILLALSLFFLAVPMLSMLFAINTFAFMLYSLVTLRRIRPDMPDIMEEEMMFGKVKYTMSISGMSCAHCSARVKSTLEAFRGVSAEISLEEKVARIKCPASLDIEKLSNAVSEAGYTVNSVEKV